MGESSQKPKLVRAIYNFQPTNTDELCFQKGDIITVSQVVEGGWWEGTLNNITGWFPSNYVREISSLDCRSGAKSPTQKSTDVKGGPRESNANQLNHNVVLQSLISTEKAFVTELEELLTRLRRLDNGSILSSAEYSGLCGNLEDIGALHKTLLASLEEEMCLPLHQQRIGGFFLKMAPQMQLLYQKYCSNHPKAAAIMQAKKDELSKYMEGFGVPSPGIMTLTTCLSKPFRRLERYSSLLKELERHTDEGHVDRGDTQRAISIYRDLAMSCAEIRKQRELEFDILHSEIRGWEGEEISQLGEVLLLSHVRIEVESGDKKERLLLFFPSLLLVLSVAPRVSGYIFEGKISTVGCMVTSLEDTDNLGFGFEITGVSGSNTDRLMVSCTSAQEKTKWLQILKQHGRLALSACAVPKPQNLQMPPAHVSVVTPLQQKFPQQSVPTNSTTFSKSSKLSLHLSCLRPYPPLRPSVLTRDEGTRSPRSGRKLLGSNRRKPVDDAKTLEDDAVILRVIEAYCTSTKARQTVNSSIFEHPPVLIAEEEKIIIDDQTIVEEKTLVDTVYSLRDQVKDLKQDLQSLRKELSKEKQARKRLEASVKGIAESKSDTHEPLTNTHS